MIRFLHMAFPLTVHQCYCHCLCHAPTASQTLVMASTPSPFSDKHTGLLCHSVILQAWERERESGEGNRSYASMHSFYLTSLWCETAQYSGFGAAAFPDQWRLNTLSWGPCSGMVEMQIFHAPEIKSFHYLLNPKENIFFLPFSPTGTQVPAWSDERERCTDPNACSTRVSAESLGRIYRLLKTFSGFNSLSQLSPKSLPKQSQWKQHICGIIAMSLATSYRLNRSIASEKDKYHHFWNTPWLKHHTSNKRTSGGRLVKVLCLFDPSFPTWKLCGFTSLSPDVLPLLL